MKKYLNTFFFLALAAGCSTEPAENENEKDVGLGDTQTTDSGFDWVEPPNHRDTAGSCPVRERPVGTTQVCDDESCTMGSNGRCRLINYLDDSDEYCTYDACNEDAECPKNEVCECGNPTDLVIGLGADENRCVPSNCKMDSDCGPAFCKPSPDICGSGQTYGYFCTTESDECLQNSDCGNSFCVFATEQSRWICSGCD